MNWIATQPCSPSESSTGTQIWPSASSSDSPVTVSSSPLLNGRIGSSAVLGDRLKFTSSPITVTRSPSEKPPSSGGLSSSGGSVGSSSGSSVAVGSSGASSVESAPPPSSGVSSSETSVSADPVSSVPLPAEGAVVATAVGVTAGGF